MEMMDSERLKLLIAEGEGLTVEFKEKYTPKIDRDMVALANSKGGYVLLGIADDGRIVGEKLKNSMKAEIHSLARNCDPSVLLGKILQVGEVVVIEVLQGEEKPYSCSSGHFKRLDAVTQKMNNKELRLSFQEAVHVSFEERINKDISWDGISKEKIRAFFKEADVHYRKMDARPVLESLNLSRDNEITNAGVLFFAKEPRRAILQCQMMLVAFKGTERLHVYDKKEVQDDLLTQYNEAISFLQKHLNVRTEIKGFNRQDIYEIPFEALREAVANAIIHRDYAFRGTHLMVEVHEDRVVISNPGGLPEGLKPDSLINVSVRRNELIADIFARMDKVERMGAGIQRIRDEMKRAELPQPKIESDAFFKITFSRLHKMGEVVGKGGQKKWSEKVVGKGGQKLTAKQTVVLKLLQENPMIARKELSKKININESVVQKYLNTLKTKQVIRRVGPDKGGHWQILK